MSAAAAPTRSSAPFVALFAVSLGWLEAVVVAYLRVLLGIPVGQGYPPFAAMMQRFDAYGTLLRIEQGRELATLVMLVAVGMLSARRGLARLGGFLLAFGVWDLAYYGALRVLVAWPRGAGDIDLLFLVPPHPLWMQPVGLPVTLAAIMTAAGAVLLARDRDLRGAGAAPTS